MHRWIIGLMFLIAQAPATAVAALAQEFPPARVATPDPALPTVSLPPDLARVLTDYETAWRGHDAAGLSALFAEDGFILPGGRPPVRGRERIREAYSGSGGPLVLRALGFAVEGSVGYIIGGYSRKEGDPDTGKFTLTLRRDATGRWLIVSDMDNSNRR